MLKTLRNAFKIKDIRNRIIFTFFMLIIIRIGSQLPVPGVNQEVFANWFAGQSSDAFSFFDAITGGSFEQMSIFALNITPYITSSIIMQLLTIAIPKLEEMQKDGEEGRKKIAEITRYVTVGLALIESVALAIGFGRSGYLTNYNAFSVITGVVTLTAGSAVLIKNSVGVAALIILTAVSFLPIIKLSVFLMLYRGCAAFMEPVADQRFCAAVAALGQAAALYLKLMFHAVLLFFLTIAIICCATTLSLSMT